MAEFRGMGARILSALAARSDFDVVVAWIWSFSNCEKVCAGVGVGESRPFERFEVVGVANTSSSMLGVDMDQGDASLLCISL